MFEIFVLYLLVCFICYFLKEMSGTFLVFVAMIPVIMGLLYVDFHLDLGYFAVIALTLVALAALIYLSITLKTRPGGTARKFYLSINTLLGALTGAVIGWFAAGIEWFKASDELQIFTASFCLLYGGVMAYAGLRQGNLQMEAEDKLVEAAWYDLDSEAFAELPEEKKRSIRESIDKFSKEIEGK